MNGKPVTTKELANRRVVDGKKGKRIGKVRLFVFHPFEKRCIGLLVKRPDAALMFHRKDLFVALDGFSVDADGALVVHDDPAATDRGAIKALGVDWDACVIWVGMPVMTSGGEVLGFVDTVSFDSETGIVSSLTTENGAANDAIVGKRTIPAEYVKGFRRGQGMALVQAGEYQGEDPNEHVERGAIMVADEALDLDVQGGVAAAAGKATAVVSNKAKKSVVKVKKVASKRIEDSTKLRVAKARTISTMSQSTESHSSHDGKTEEPLIERLEESAHGQTTVHGHTMDRANVFKFAGLIAFFVIMAIVMVAIWPYVADVFSEGGVDRLVERAQNAGAAGVLMLLGVQFLQIVVAFIPGEVVQLAAGLMYGPLFGSIIVLVGCVISSTIIYHLVHALGMPFVQGMVSTEHLDKFRKFEETGKLDIIVFVLFLIPGMPKDVFTYLVPLTDMPYKKFIVLTTIGRIPGVVGSTYAASGFASGQIVGPIVVLVLLAVIAVVAIVFRDKIINAFHREQDS